MPTVPIQIPDFAKEANVWSDTTGSVDRLESTSVESSYDGASTLLVVSDNISAVRKCCTNQNGNEVGKPDNFAVNSRIIRTEFEYKFYKLVCVILDRKKRILNKKDISIHDLFKSKRNIKEIENEDQILDVVSLNCNRYKAEIRRGNLISSGYIDEAIQLLNKNSKNSKLLTFPFDVYVYIKLLQSLKKRYSKVTEIGACFKSLIENENKLTKHMDVTLHSYKSESLDKKSVPAMHSDFRVSTELRLSDLQKVGSFSDSLQVCSPITYCNLLLVFILQQGNYCCYYLIIMTRRERIDVARRSRTDIAAITITDVAGIMRTDVAGIMRTDVAGIMRTDVAGIMRTGVAGIKRTDVAGIKRTDIAGIMRTDVAGIMSTDVAGIMKTGVAGIKRTDVAGIKRTDIAGIMRTDVAGIKRTDIAGIMRTDIAGITRTHIAEIKTTDVAGISTTDIEEISRTDMARITTDITGNNLTDIEEYRKLFNMYIGKAIIDVFLISTCDKLASQKELQRWSYANINSNLTFAASAVMSVQVISISLLLPVHEIKDKISFTTVDKRCCKNEKKTYRQNVQHMLSFILSSKSITYTAKTSSEHNNMEEPFTNCRFGIEQQKRFPPDKPKYDNQVEMLDKNIVDTLFDKFLKYKGVSVLVKNEQGRNTEGKRNYLDVLNHVRLKMYSFTPSRELTNVCVNMLPYSVCGIPWNQFERETMRLASFAKYPTTAVKSPANLASSGFVYVGNGLSDRVKCYFCSVEKESWEINDVIDDVHKSLSPSCPMVIVQFSNNVASTGLESPRRMAAVNTGAVPLSVSMGTAYSVYDEVDNHRPHAISQPATESTTHQRSTSQRESAVTPSLLANTNGRINTPGSANTSLLPVLGMLEQTNNSAVRNNRINPRSQHSHNSISINEEDSIRNLQNYSTTNQDNVSHHPNINAQVYAIPPGSNGTAAPEEPNPTQQNPQLTYQLLGIFHERPKYPDYAILARRLHSFDGWPDDHPISKEDLAKSGLYFAGYGDCCKCFFCGGGLRNWEDGDNAYVEHARWFDKCSYIRQYMGMEFVEAVRSVKSRGGTITFKDVTDHMTLKGQSIQNLFNDKKISDDAAVRSLIDEGYDAEAVSRAATSLRESGELLSADLILRKLRDQQTVNSDGAVAGATASDGAVAGAMASDATDLVDLPGEGQLQALKEQNYALRSYLTCKICMDKEVRIVFLPCGHLISCQECAIALQDCPLCRSHIRARARANIN